MPDTSKTRRGAGFGDAGAKGCWEGCGGVERGGRMSRPDPRSGSLHRAGFPLPSRACRQLRWGGDRHVSPDRLAIALPGTHPSVCPATLTASSWRAPLAPSWMSPNGPGRGQKGGSPKGRGGQAFSLCQDFGLGVPRKGVGLEVGFPATSQERALHHVGTQRAAPTVATLVH